MLARVRAGLAVGLSALTLTSCSGSTDGDTDSRHSSSGIPSDLSAAESQPVDDPYYPHNGEPYFDALHYDLGLDWDADTSTLTGTTKLDFRVTESRDTVQLDFGEPLSVTSAKLDGEPIETTEHGDDLRLETGSIEPKTQHRLTIEYEGTPRPVKAAGSRTDLTSVGWTTESDGSVWTMQEPWGAFTWYPVNDHPSDKAYYSATVTADDSLFPVFNGKLTDKWSDGDTTTTGWVLDEPAASYLTTIAIGDYTATTRKGPDGLPLTYWTRPEDDRLLPTMEESPRVLEWLVGELGPYPFDTGGIVTVPSDSGMETQTMVTLGTDVRQSKPDLLAVVAHEYAHQWVGDTVTPNNWKDLWLNEGLAMYIQARWTDAEGGPSYQDQIAQWADLDNAYRRMYGPPGAYDRSEFASLNVYTSGAVMLDRIRQRVGDDVFADALRSWPQQHRNESVDRTDFIAYLSERTGTDVLRFVNAWLTSPTTPRTTL